MDTSAEKTGVVDNISHGRGAVYNNINAAITLQGRLLYPLSGGKYRQRRKRQQLVCVEELRHHDHQRRRHGEVF